MSATLEIIGLDAGYGRIRVLRDLTFTVPAGAVVALVGPNGAGKTTTLRAITGLVRPSAGRILLDGRRIDGRRPYELARRGVVLVPEGRGIFPGLTVADNLDVTARAMAGPDRDQRIEEVLELFPILEERWGQIAGTLSGGQQQMLALSRAFLATPRILLLDEISMGLAPIIVEDLYQAIERLKHWGHTILLVEQFLTHALALADLCYVMGKGHVRFVGEPHELRADGHVAGYLS